MCGNCISVCGGRSEENGRQKKMKPMVERVKHDPLQAIFDSRSLVSSAVEDSSEEDVDKKAEAFINAFHRDLESQTTESDV